MLTATLKSLADPTRLRLLAVLEQGELTVQDLTCVLAMGQSRVSRHLKILCEAGILAVARQGTWGYYRFADDNPLFQRLWGACRPALEDLPQRRDDLERLGHLLDDRRHRNQAFFDLHARQWDRLTDSLLPVVPFRDALLSRVPRCTTLLEVGVGTGQLLAKLKEKADTVIGVDHSPAMLDEAQRQAAIDSLEGVDLRLGEMTYLPLADHSVDCAVLSMVLHHAAQPATVLVELARVLVAGGLLIVAELKRHDEEWVRERLSDQWLGFEPADLTLWLKSAGFSSIATEQLTGDKAHQAVLLLTAVKGGGSLSKLQGDTHYDKYREY
jgi:ubiquinone/menaquinone biosynthesis C-methylase UbiE